VSTLRITFLWEDSGDDAYDNLLAQLTAIGAWDIEEEPGPEPEPVENPKRKKR
jgi:hypothetical protein